MGHAGMTPQAHLSSRHRDEGGRNAAGGYSCYTLLDAAAEDDAGPALPVQKLLRGHVNHYVVLLCGEVRD